MKLVKSVRDCRAAFVLGAAIGLSPAIVAASPAPDANEGAFARVSWTTAAADADTLPWAAIVDAKYTGASGAAGANGIPTFRSIGDALSSTSVNGGVRTVVFIKNGRYREKLTVDRPRITLRGESRDGTIITFDAVSDTPAPGGGTYGTRGSYTLRIVAPDFRAEHLTIENAFDYAANAAKSDSNPTKFKNPQGVALMTDLGNDRSSFVDVKLLGNQDTLFTNSGRSWFYRSIIAGHVDFIFGAGIAMFEDSDIISKDRGSKTNNGYVAAPSTNKAQQYGLVFLNSRLKKESPEMAANSVTLGRPWHPFADPNAVGQAVYINCWMDNHIGDKGWDRMSSVDSTGTRVWYEPESARFFEYKSSGPGAVNGTARRQLTDAQAATYTRANVFGDWKPVP